MTCPIKKKKKNLTVFFIGTTVNSERRHGNLHLVRKSILSGKNACVCLCLFVWGEQAGLLLIMMEAPVGICRWRALLQLGWVREEGCSRLCLRTSNTDPPVCSLPSHFTTQPPVSCNFWQTFISFLTPVKITLKLLTNLTRSLRGIMPMFESCSLSQ